MKKIVALLMVLVLCLVINTTAFAKESKQSQKIKVSQSSYTKQVGDSKFNLSATTSDNGKLTYKTGNKKVVTVSNSGVVTVVGKGSTKISITAAETKKYKKATKSVNITVKERQRFQKISSLVQLEQRMRLWYLKMVRKFLPEVKLHTHN